jgi:hypothetical protein
MANHLYVARVDTVAISATTTKTFVQIVTAAGQRVRVRGWGVSFNGTDGTKTPIRVDLLRQTTAGTSSALTLVKADPLSGTATTTALQSFSAEPTAGDVLWSMFFTPVGGGGDFTSYPGDEFVLEPSTRLGIRCTTATGVANDVAAYIKFAE